MYITEKFAVSADSQALYLLYVRLRDLNFHCSDFCSNWRISWLKKLPKSLVPVRKLANFVENVTNSTKKTKNGRKNNSFFTKCAWILIRSWNGTSLTNKTRQRTEWVQSKSPDQSDYRWVYSWLITYIFYLVNIYIVQNNTVRRKKQLRCINKKSEIIYAKIHYNFQILRPVNWFFKLSKELISSESWTFPQNGFEFLLYYGLETPSLAKWVQIFATFWNSVQKVGRRKLSLTNFQRVIFWTFLWNVVRLLLKLPEMNDTLTCNARWAYTFSKSLTIVVKFPYKIIWPFAKRFKFIYEQGNFKNTEETFKMNFLPLCRHQ